MEIKIKDETKSKFEALLKQALNSKCRRDVCSTSTQKLVTESLSSTENLVEETPYEEVVQVQVHDDNNFILNKFLSDTTSVRDEISSDSKISDVTDNSKMTYIKPPVPRPRKLKKTPSISTTDEGTHAIDLPVVVRTPVETNRESSTIDSVTESFSKASLSEKIAVIGVNTVQYENETKKRKHRKTSTLKHDEEVIQTDTKANVYSYEKIIGIDIHKSDRLKLNSLVIHPVVKIHIINSCTGEYLNKSDKNRPTVFYYENNNVVYITPIISEPYNLYDKGSLYPKWEETLLINEDINSILKDDTLVLFEIIDFVSFSIANSQSNNSSRGWHKIAWAFLKPIGKHNTLNINKKARLQLYYPGRHKKVSAKNCDIFHWLNNRKKYPSSLYVTIKGIIPPCEIIETLRSKTPMYGDTALGHIFDYPEEPQIARCEINEEPSNNIEVLWSRAKYETCKLPNKCVAELNAHEEGCLILKFSNNGLYLACAVVIDEIYVIIIYSVKSYKELNKFLGHQGLIYSINWSKDDQVLITASADCTVCLWSLAHNNFIEMLPHPSYVYTSEISCRNVIATGCYDELIRIWCKSTEDTSYDLFQEIEGHQGYVTSLCFNNKATMLYSSDSQGTIIESKYHAEENKWNLKREVKLPDLKNTIINQILLHPRERRLLINARDSVIRIMDIKTTCTLYWLEGANNKRVKIIGSFSPCGNFIFTGNENGCIHVWNSDSGQSVAMYTPYTAFRPSCVPINCVQYHPIDNIIAISHNGRHLPILLVLYDPTLDGKSNVGLETLQNDAYKRHKNPKTSSYKVLQTESEVSQIKNGTIKFQDVLQKIDRLVTDETSPSDSYRSSKLNNN